MAVDYSVALACDPKRHFGNGDPLEGSVTILERLKAKSRGEMMVQIATQDGQDPASITITLHVHDRDGNPVVKEATLADLEAEAKPLEQHASACTDCPANLLKQPYGCFGAVNYPIPTSAERWLMGRVQPKGTVGANLCLDFMSEFGIQGDSIREMRKAGFFESSKPQKVTFKTGFFKSTSVTSDQLLESILMAGQALDPGHCFGILVWLGAIKVDGKVPSTPDDAATIEKLVSLETLEDKQQHATLELGPAANSDEVEALRMLVKAIYLAWFFDVPLLMSA